MGSHKANRVKTESQYLLAGRKTGLLALTATLVMTELNTSTLIAFSSAGYGAGWWALSLTFIFFIGLLFYGVTVAKKWKAFNGLSVAHFFTERYGRDIGTFAAVILFSAMALFSATYVKSMAMLFAPLFPEVSILVLSGSICLLILLITLRGGLVSVIGIDVFSFLIISLFFPILIYYISSLPSDSSTIPLRSLEEGFAALPPEFVFSLHI